MNTGREGGTAISGVAGDGLVGAGIELAGDGGDDAIGADFADAVGAVGQVEVSVTESYAREPGSGFGCGSVFTGGIVGRSGDCGDAERPCLRRGCRPAQQCVNRSDGNDLQDEAFCVTEWRHGRFFPLKWGRPGHPAARVFLRRNCDKLYNSALAFEAYQRCCGLGPHVSADLFRGSS